MPVMRAEVATERPDRYAKQLVSHLGRKGGVEYEGKTAWLTFDPGACSITPDGEVLLLEASADDAETVERMQGVVGGHLERFGEKDGLAVAWESIEE